MFMSGTCLVLKSGNRNSPDVKSAKRDPMKSEWAGAVRIMQAMHESSGFGAVPDEVHRSQKCSVCCGRGNVFAYVHTYRKEQGGHFCVLRFLRSELWLVSLRRCWTRERKHHSAWSDVDEREHERRTRSKHKGVSSQRRQSSARGSHPKFGYIGAVGSLFSAENLQYLWNGASRFFLAIARLFCLDNLCSKITRCRTGMWITNWYVVNVCTAAAWLQQTSDRPVC